MRWLVAIAVASIGCGWDPVMPGPIAPHSSSREDVPAPPPTVAELPPPPPAPSPPVHHESPPPSPVLQAPANIDATRVQLAGFADQVCACTEAHDSGCAHRALIDFASWMNVASEELTILGTTATGMQSMTQTLARIRSCAEEAMQPEAPAP